MKILRRLGWGLVLTVLSLACGDRGPRQPSITIATSANMQFAMEELTTRFTKQSGIACKLVLGSSGKLTAQVRAGAPFDLFVAANMTYPEELFRLGLATERPRIYATGELVLWTIKDHIPLSVKGLSGDSVVHIAIPNPRLAPYGQAAMEALQHYELDSLLQHKLVMGESISQANQFIISGAADVGFTALSVVVAPGMEGKGRWKLVDKSLHHPIRQGVVLLRQDTPPSQQAIKFYNFLFSPEAREVLKNFGYSEDEHP